MSARSQDVVIEIEDMRSETDAMLVADALRAVGGVSAASASCSQALAIVTADSTIATSDILCAAIAAAGFTPGEVRFPE